jgi:predicted PurR-regulated permease PerM
MNNSEKYNWSTLIISIVIGIILYFIWLFNFRYVTPLTLGLIIATLTYPLFKFIYKKLSALSDKSFVRSFSAIITVLGICGSLSLILNFTTQQLVHEIPTFANGIIDFANKIPENPNITKPLESIGISKQYLNETIETLNKNSGDLGGLLGKDNGKASGLFTEENLNNIFNVGKQSLNLFFNQLVYLVIFLLSWYNFLIYGEIWLQKIFNLLPFSSKEAQNIVTDFENGVRNVILANFLSGLIHTVICALAMWVFGIQSIFIISVLIFFIGVLPLSPSELGYAIPVLLILPINPLFAVMLAILGEIVILWTNYIVIPKIIASGKEGNSLLILTSILSGIAIFGIMGFIIGPLIIIFVQTLFGILSDRIKLKKDIKI